MALYQLAANGGVVLTTTGMMIPADPRNADWLAYQVWAAVAGNAADPAPAPVPVPLQMRIAPSDYQMARGHEDLVALLIAKGVIAATDLNGAALANLNARRALRGETAIGS